MNVSQHPLDDKLLLGRYRVVRLLGEGGMGTVHLARVEGAEGFTRPVVVKRMRREISSTDEGNRLFIREAKILSRMQHPAIVGISDFGIEDGAHVMVLEYVHGYTLSSWLEYRRLLQRPLPVDVCLFILRRVLDALHYAHHFDTEEGQEIEIVHRDVAPDNILMSNRGYVHLLDFGVASIRGPRADKSTQAGAFRGKLGYAAPETIQGQPATPRSDQYSAAVVLFELLTHETLFVSDSMGATVVRMVNEIPALASTQREDISPGLDPVLARALAKNPEERFESTLAFSRALRPFQERDDDEVAQQLQDLVREDFEVLPQKIDVEGLKSRGDALAKLFSTRPEPVGRVRDTHPALMSPPDACPAPDSPPSRAEAAAPPAAPVAAPLPPQHQKQLRRLLWGLLAVGGLLALGLGAAVSLLARGGGGAEQVVVVGGDRFEPEPSMQAATARTEEPRTTAGPAAEPLPPAHDPEATAAAVEDPPVKQSSSKQSSKPAHGSASATAALTSGDESQDLQQKLTRAVQQQSGSFQNCFTVNLESAGSDSTAVLHFSVAKQGGTAQVKVEPARVAATSLGSCLERAARQVQFPALSDATSFRVPVRARVTRTREPK